MLRTVIDSAQLLMAFMIATLAEKGKTLEEYFDEHTPTADKVVLWVFSDIISDDEHSELSSSDWVNKYYMGMPAMSVEWILSWFEGMYSDATWDDEKGVRLEEPNLDEVEKANKIAQGRVWHALRIINNEEFEWILQDNTQQ